MKILNLFFSLIYYFNSIRLNKIKQQTKTKKMSSNRYPSDPVQKMRVLYKQAQQEVNNNQLNRITQQRMKKRYSYAAKQVQRKQINNDKNQIDELIFYRNKFHSLIVLVGESMRESYNKIKFQTEVKNILKENWQETQSNGKSQRKSILGKAKETANVPIIKHTASEIRNNGEDGVGDKRDNKRNVINFDDDENNNNTVVRRSVSPLQEFFSDKQKQINQSKKIFSFQSVIPQSQLSNSKLLRDMKSMTKKSNHHQSTYQQITSQNINREDSRVRDLRRENEQLQKILAKRQQKTEIVQDNRAYYNSNGDKQRLQKQLYQQQIRNKQLKQRIANSQTVNNRSKSPYYISLRKNNVNQIQQKNLINGTSKRAMNYIDQQRSVNNHRNNNNDKSQTKSSQVNSFISNNDQKSVKSSNTSSIMEKYKEVYINSTPQILFQNELIKIMVIRYPLKIQQKHIPSSQKLNPQDLNPNQQRLQLIVINNSHKIVKNNELNVKLDYDYDQNCHKVEPFKKANNGYSKIADTARDIVYREIIRVKLIDRSGYNEEIRAMVKAEFSYDSQAKKNRIFSQMGKNRVNDNFYIEVKLPVTFIQFSSKPFSHRHFDSKKTKLTIKPNPLFDTLEHTYMNTNLPFLKSTNPKVIKEHAVLYGRSFIHDKNSRDGKGTYLENEISLFWFEKKETRYVSIETIEDWVYLLAYIFLDVEEEEEEFERQFRKPSMHVFFNLENKQFF